MSKARWLGILLLTALAGCGSSGDQPQVGSLERPVETQLNILVADETGGVTLFDRSLEELGRFQSGGNSALALDALGTGYHNFDTFVRVLDRPIARITRDISPQYTELFERDLDPNLSGSVELRGSCVIQEQGFLVCADSGGRRLVVLSTAARLPYTVVKTAIAPVDVEFDEKGDRLFVAFDDGRIGVYDNWTSTDFSGEPSRLISIKDLHRVRAIAYQTASDTLLVAATGPEDNDGEIFEVREASGQDGLLELEPAITGLGQPVDLDLAMEQLQVVDSVSRTVTTYENRLARQTAVLNEPPVAVNSESRQPLLPDNSDIDGDLNLEVVQVVVAAHQDTKAYRVSPDLQGAPKEFQVERDAGSAMVDRQGDLFVTTPGGFCHLARASRQRRGFTPRRDRFVSTDRRDTRGFDIADEVGILMVADPGNSEVAIYGKQAEGETVAATTTPAPPWDLDYDTTSDTLYVALTDGSVAVYETYLADPFQQQPTRLLKIQGAEDLRGVVHDARRDLLILSDVGDTNSLTDGKIYVVDQASRADGVVTPRTTVTGDQTQLGNPVDIAYDGEHLWVAEVGNSKVLRFDNVREVRGGNIPPAAVLTGIAEPSSVNIDARRPGRF